jgi:hypothetical protein
MTKLFTLQINGEEILGDQEKLTFWKWKKKLGNPPIEQNRLRRITL